MYMLVYCVDRDIGKSGIYKTHEAAHEAMLSRIANLVGERPKPNADGFAVIAECAGEVFYDRAYLNFPTYGDYDHYAWALLEV